MLKEFINEYKSKFVILFKDCFLVEIARICTLLKDPTFHPSKRLIEILNEVLSL